MARPDAVLFTAFEPSGDALAAGLIAQIKVRRPQMKVYALGGPRMAAAGAELIETTTEHAVMLAGAISKVREHRARLKRLKVWLHEHPIAAHVPTDSPAANWSICKLVRQIQREAKIVHLAAPQVWAWATWRINKLRRLTDHVLCLLPFEEKWFRTRNVPATFVGHPMFDSVARSSAAPRLRDGRLKLALLPGSRSGEWRKNWPTMLKAYQLLTAKNEGLAGCVAAVDQPAGEWLVSHTLTSPPPALRWSDGRIVSPDLSLPSGMEIVFGRTPEILEWADVVLVVSGTATLEVAMHRKPMVVLYNISRISWHLAGRWIVRTRTFSLPNLILEGLGERSAVRELVPHFGNVRVVVDEVDRLLKNQDARQTQRAAIDRVCAEFESVSFKDRAAERFFQVAGL